MMQTETKKRVRVFALIIALLNPARCRTDDGRPAPVDNVRRISEFC